MRTYLTCSLFSCLIVVACSNEGASPRSTRMTPPESSSTGTGAAQSTGAGGEGVSDGGAGGLGTGGLGAGGDGGGGADTALAAFTDTAAGAVCGALFRCCTSDNITDYFAPWANDQLLQELGYAARLPPATPLLDEASCVAIVKEMMDIVPFGDWVAQANAGLVTFDPSAVGACATALETAACGAPVNAELFNSKCFAYAAPFGLEKRSMFTRTGGAGSPCSPIKDGTGARFFGSCDPTQFFCCYANPENPSAVCSFPFDAEGNARTGECKAVSDVGETCSRNLTTVQLCATGVDCDGATERCVAQGTQPLATGETCVDESFNTLGICQDSYCELDTRACAPLKPDGSACTFGFECQSTSCAEGRCGPLLYCAGF